MNRADGFRTPALDPAWDALRHAGDSPERLPTPQEWKRWGEQTTQPVQITGAADVTIEFQQFLSARFHHPTGWLLGFQIQQNSGGLVGGVVIPDTSVFTGSVILGCGSGRFQGDFALGTLDNTTRGPLLVVVGPYPAETIVVSGRVKITPPTSVGFPYTSAISFGAFVSPQVWQ
jgi:hypothetical protein